MIILTANFHRNAKYRTTKTIQYHSIQVHSMSAINIAQTGICTIAHNMHTIGKKTVTKQFQYLQHILLNFLRFNP